MRSRLATRASAIPRSTTDRLASGAALAVLRRPSPTALHQCALRSCVCLLRLEMRRCTRGWIGEVGQRQHSLSATATLAPAWLRRTRRQPFHPDSAPLVGASLCAHTRRLLSLTLHAPSSPLVNRSISGSPRFLSTAALRRAPALIVSAAAALSEWRQDTSEPSARQSGRWHSLDATVAHSLFWCWCCRER